MRFKEFLAEAEKKVDLSMFKNNIELVMTKKLYLYRGTRSKTNKSLFAVPANGRDFSAYVADQRTMPRDVKGSSDAARYSKNWDVPDRSLSYFVTRDTDHASRFGHLLLVIPADDIDLYAWSATDFNIGSSKDFKVHFDRVSSVIESLKFGIFHMKPDTDVKMYQIMLDIVKKSKLKQSELKDLSSDDPRAITFADNMVRALPELQAAFDEDAKNLKKLGAQSPLMMVKTLQKSISKYGTSAEDVFKQATSKEAFKIKTFDSLADLPRKLKGPDELWFNGKYLAVFIGSRWLADENVPKILQALKDMT